MATIYVDDAIHPYGRMKMAHLFSVDIEALHDFAARLDPRLRRWFQEPPKASWWHYDISKGYRAKALELGAVAADRYECTIVSKQQMLDYVRQHAPDRVEWHEDRLKRWAEVVERVREGVRRDGGIDDQRSLL